MPFQERPINHRQDTSPNLWIQLCKRLHILLDHFPESPNKQSTRCTVHQWAMGDNQLEYCNNIMKCSECRVSLCYGCFRLFHMEQNLVARKAELKKQFFQQFKKEKRCVEVIKNIQAKEREQPAVVAL
jgi:hypothetical protein